MSTSETEPPESDGSSKDDQCKCGHARDHHGPGGCEVCGLAGLNILRNHSFIPEGGPHIHEWGPWELRPTIGDNVEASYCACGADKARQCEPEACYCGCAPGAHMGRPGGCQKHGFHEFIRASFVPGANPDAPACITCGHAQHAPLKGASCAGWDAEGAGCACGASKARQCEPEKTCEHPDLYLYGSELPAGDGPGMHFFFCPDCKVRMQNPEDLRKKTLEPPERPAPRPPYAVAYAVQGGALYEVALPGDATACAEDGALIITHTKTPVLGIVRVTPMRTEES